MQSCLEFVVSDARQNVAKVDDHLIVDGLHTLEFSVDHDLQARIPECGKERNEATVTVFRRRQPERLFVKLTAVDYTRTARQQVHKSKCRHGVMFEPVSEEMAVFIQTESDQLAKFKSQCMHFIVMLVEKLLYPLVLFETREGRLFVQWQG